MAKLNGRLKAALPTGLRRWLRERKSLIQLRREFKRDAERYANAAAESTRTLGLTPIQLEAQLTKDYHRVEKGLALPAPKRPFGADVLRRLDEMIPQAAEVAAGSTFLARATSARTALAQWNQDGNIDDAVAPLLTEATQTPPAAPGADRLFTTRRSVRHFSPDPIDSAIVHEAISLALNSPSVCNRAPWRVRSYTGEDARRVLAHQNGNRGFGDNIPTLLLVTVDAGLMTGAGERNQAWIEGGIFGSTLVWALHSLGVATCMLNLSLTNAAADDLRSETGMNARELPIMMIAVGHAARGARVAASRRRALSEVLINDSE